MEESVDAKNSQDKSAFLKSSLADASEIESVSGYAQVSIRIVISLLFDMLINIPHFS